MVTLSFYTYCRLVLFFCSEGNVPPFCILAISLWWTVHHSGCMHTRDWNFHYSEEQQGATYIVKLRNEKDKIGWGGGLFKKWLIMWINYVFTNIGQCDRCTYSIIYELKRHLNCHTCSTFPQMRKPHFSEQISISGYGNLQLRRSDGEGSVLPHLSGGAGLSSGRKTVHKL